MEIITSIPVKIMWWKDKYRSPTIKLDDYSHPLCGRDAKGLSNWGMSAVVEIWKIGK